MSKRVLCFFLIFSMPLCFLFPCTLYAQEKIVVGFGGLWTAGPATNYPIYSRIKKKHPGKMAKAVINAVERVTEATGKSYSLFIKDFLTHRFEIPSPQYPIHLNFTGLSSNEPGENNLNHPLNAKTTMKMSKASCSYYKISQGYQNGLKTI